MIVASFLVKLMLILDNSFYRTVTIPPLFRCLFGNFGDSCSAGSSYITAPYKFYSKLFLDGFTLRDSGLESLVLVFYILL